MTWPQDEIKTNSKNMEGKLRKKGKERLGKEGERRKGKEDGY